MPFCPVCEDEFRPEFTTCRRCEAQLVPELPDTTPSELKRDVDHLRSVTGSEWIEVYVGVRGAKLDLVRSLMHGAGVHMRVQTLGSSSWDTLGALGAVTGMPNDFNAARILVPTDDRDRAVEALEAAESGSLALGDEGDDRFGSHEPDDPGATAPEGFEVAWSLSHVAAEVNRLTALLAERGIDASVAENDVAFPWDRWKEMSEKLSFPNDVRNVRLLVDAGQVEEAQRIIEEASAELTFDEEELTELEEDELDEADRRYDGPAQEIGDMGGPPLADR